MSESVAQRLLDAEGKVDDPSQALQLAEVYATLRRAIWSDLKARGDIPLIRRNLQREHAVRVSNALLRPTAAMPADAKSLLRAEARALRAELAAAAGRPGVVADRIGAPGREPRDAGRGRSRRQWCGRRYDVGAARTALRFTARRPSMTARRPQTHLTLSPPDNRALANVCGPLDSNLRQIEAAFDVEIARRGGEFTISGAGARAARAAEALQRFYAAAEKPLSVDDIQLGLVEITSQVHRHAEAAPAASDDLPHCARAGSTCTAARPTRSPT